MHVRNPHLLVPVLGVLLALFSPSEPARPGIKAKRTGAAVAGAVSPDGVWARQSFLDEVLREALAWTKAATQSDFVSPPTVRPSSADEVAAFLATDLDAVLGRLGGTSPAEKRATARALAEQLVAAYDPAGNVIHVLPEHARRAAGDDPDQAGPDVLRLVLVRAATIAQDRQLYPEWKQALDATDGLDALHCAGAVLEGHATYVAERVAARRAETENFPAQAFDRMLALLTAPQAGGGGLAADAEFAIVKGLAFVKVAARKRGGIEKALRQPPKDRAAFFDPEAWFATAKKPPPEGTPARVAKEFDGLLPEDEGWTRAEAAIDATGLESFLLPVPKAQYAAVLAAYESGTSWTSRHEDGREVEVFLLEFRNEGMAKAFADISKGALSQRKGTAEEGAGRDSGLVGYAGSEEIERDGTKRTRRVQVTYEGGFALGIRTDHVGARREAQDDALEAAAEVLAKAQRTRSNRRDR